jgi:hypothetical protein
MNKISIIIAGILVFFLGAAPPAHCQQGQGKYVTLKYGSQEVLRSFDDQIYLGRSLRSMMQKNTVTVQDEVLAKVDLVVEKAETVLDMFPNKLHFTLILLPDSDGVSRVFYQNYHKRVNYLSFYSLSQKAIYISVDDANIHILAHEIGHAIVDHYFKVRPPYNIHELMAQFVEKHITD